MSVSDPQSLTVTPRATVVESLAEREAELLGQRCTSAHILLAIVWEGKRGGGVASRVLAESGIDEPRFDALRERVMAAPEAERGVSARNCFGVAASAARAMGLDYIGTEHQLLAIAGDESLADSLLPRGIRSQIRERVHEILGPAQAS